MKMYRGIRTESGCVVTVIEEGVERSLDLRHDLRNHSPDGANWGYGGSGPAQLSLALVADATGDDELAQRTYQAFKRRVVAGFEGDRWELGDDFIRQIVAAIDFVED